MMLDKIKNFVFQAEDAPPPQTETAGPVKAAAPASDDKYIQVLRQAIRARNTPFTSLLLAIDKLNMIPDMTVRTQAAFATITGDGRSAQDILRAIDVHVADLEAAKMQFNQALQRRLGETIGAMQAELNAIPTQDEQALQRLAELSEQINQLNQAIATRNSRKVELVQAISVENSNMEQESKLFEGAFTVVKGELQNEQLVLQSILK